MPYCPHCGTKIDASFSFCPNCGFKVASLQTTGMNARLNQPATPSRRGDFVKRYLSIDPYCETYEVFAAKVDIKEDSVTIISAMDSEIKPAVRSGDASASVVLGVLYEKGFTVEKDRDKAFHCYIDAAEKGYPLAEWLVGLFNMEADNYFALFWDLDLARGYRWFLKSAEHGYCAAMVNLGNCCSEGIGTAQNKSEALRWYKKAAELGFVLAEHKLGRCLHFADGFPHDYGEALKWYCRAASQGFAPSQNNLGLMYDDGLCVPVDHAEAAKWYKKAAEQGLDTAQYNLGNCYANGSGVDVDYSKAEEWYKKAAEQGNATYQLNLARWMRYHPVLEDGIRFYGNYESWYKKAAEQGNVQAQYELAGELMSDRFDYCERAAAEWYHKAAVQGHSGAQFELGVCFAEGKGVNKDLSAARQWLQEAADQGVQSAIEYLNRLNR